MSKMAGLLLVLLPAVVSAEFKLSEYQYYKDIKGSGKGNFYLKLDRDIYAHGNQFFHDLRVVDKNNKEQKYDISRVSDKRVVEEKDLPLKVVFRKGNTFVLDRGLDAGYVDKLMVKTSSVNFSRVADVYGSNLKDSRYERLTDRGGDLIAISPAKRDLEIKFKYTDHRFLKVVFSGSEGDFKVDDFYIRKKVAETEPGIKEKIELSFESRLLSDGKQEVLIIVPADNLPLESFIVKTAQKDFERPITLYASNNREASIYHPGERYDSKKDYWVRKYSGTFSAKVYYDDQSFRVADNKKYYLLIIDNGDNDPLDILEVKGERYPDILYLNNLDFSKNSYRLYYGNPLAKKANYDLSSFKRDLNQELILSKEVKNPLYKAPAKKLGEDKPYLIYIFIVLLVIILLWFVYKILKEEANKDLEDDDYVDKL